MIISNRQFTDPFLNIAAEEYFIKNAQEDMCMIWVNDRSVIIGKHQNAYAEINYPFVRSNHIPVIRRISGGGAVYHDAGNVNFSFILKAMQPNHVDFRKFTSIIMGFMQSLGIQVNVSKRNSLFIGERKFSGHAEHLFHNKVLHHGTLLFNTDLSILEQSLSPAREFQSKAMASVRSMVTNIAPLLPTGTTIQHFIDLFINWLLEYFQGSSIFQFKAEEMEAIERLAETKYKTWEWNFGYSPAYTFRIDIQTDKGVIEATTRVENGKILYIHLDQANDNSEISQKLNLLTGTLHKEEEIIKFVENNQSGLELAGINTVSLREAFFK